MPFIKIRNLALLTFCVAIFFSSSEIEAKDRQNSPAISLEARLLLSPADYHRLIDHFSGPWKARQDFYINAFDGINWAYPNYKIRLKLSESYLWQWQVSEVLETEIATCGQRNLEIKKSKIWRKEAKTKHWESIIRQARETLSSPERIDQSYLESMDQSFLDLFSKTKLPGPLNWGREQGDWLVSYTNSKMRVSGVITDNDGRKLEVVLGQTWDWDEGGKFRIRYELEAEPDDPRQWDNPSDILKLICQTYDITHWPKELSEAEPSPSSDYTLKRIQSSN